MRRDFSLSDSDSAAARIVKMSREAIRYQADVLVALDSIPAADEACVRRVARALRRLWEMSIPVVFSIAPEAAQLLEQLPECSVVGPSDLLVSSVAGATPRDAAFVLRRGTRGIPSLVRAASLVGDVSKLTHSPAYLDAYAKLMSAALRESLIEEERTVRLAMLLLGEGSADELKEVLSADPDETLSQTRLMAPLFGVSERLDSFCCIQSESMEALSFCHPFLLSICDGHEELVLACALALFDRGDIRRAATVCRLVEGDCVSDLVIRHGPELLDAGEAQLVRQVLDSRGVTDAMEDAEVAIRGELGFLAALSCATSALCSPERPGNLIAVDSGTAAEGGELDALLISDARAILSGDSHLNEAPKSTGSALTFRMLAHREALFFMLGGHFASAMRLLIANSAPSDPLTVSGALLCIDLELARLLLCDASSGDSSAVRRAQELLRSPSAKGLSGYADLLDVVRAMLDVEDARVDEIEAIERRAERSGEALVQSIALMAGSVADLRHGASARANVRALLAATIARKAHLRYVGRTSQLFGEIARFNAGEHVSLRAEPKIKDDLAVVVSLAREAMLSEEDALAAGLRQYPELPREALWLVGVISEGMGEFSLRLKPIIPREWRVPLLTARAASPEDMARLLQGSDWRRKAYAAGEGRLNAPASADGVPVRVNLLGGFSISVRGVLVPESKIGQRSIEAVVEYLAVKGGSVRRFKVVEQVWPDCDYITGFGRVYQTTSALRSAVAELGCEDDPFISSRSSRTIALNPAVVTSDVAEFKACARDAVDTTDDLRAVDLARKAEVLYQGDLHIPPADATGMVGMARTTLRGLYADAMVAGGEAALRLGKKRTATRLSMNAVLADELREDAIIALIRALRASGRNEEADAQYRRFTRELAERMKRQPSRSLVQAIGEPPLAAAPKQSALEECEGEERRAG